MIYQEILPKEPGSYLLRLWLWQSVDISVGRLGKVQFLPGNYLYAGSAFGPGGLAARIGRHLIGGMKCHWHIDYLRAITSVEGYGTLVDVKRYECVWSRLMEECDAQILVPGFGSSDCSSGCLAHLGYFSDVMNCDYFLKGLKQHWPEFTYVSARV